MEPNEQEVRDETAERGGPPNGHGTSSGNGGPPGLLDQVMDALRKVNDPELGINIVDLGLVYDVRLEDGTVHIDYTLTTMGCPIGPLIEEQIRQMLEPVEGVDQVEAEMTLSPPWTPDKMSEEAKAALGFF
ncbi:MAG TPA: metal-sulfur cluster assembly factor [Actinomycetota bacterium]|jgi:metal-sulfur cluster biosynthetic enzyme|nr:metal-sulfur cluster assembly factor [Actinomycetota bacterium]